MISGVSNQKDWQDLGYQVSGRFTKGNRITLQRPIENSPNPIPDISQLPSVELKFYADRSIEAESVADKIYQDINTHKLSPKKQILVVVFSFEAENLVADALNRKGINFYIPSALQPNSFDVKWPNNDPNRFWHEGAVTISRIHRAKGNEAEMVYVMGVDNIARNENSLKFRNQLFVAMTRAKGWVHISGLNQACSFYDEFIKVIEAKGCYEFYFGKRPNRDLADTDLSPEWSEVTKEVANQYHSFITGIADKVPVPALSYEIESNHRVIAQPLLCWPDKHVALVEDEQNKQDYNHSLVQANDPLNKLWKFYTIAEASNDLDKFLTTLK